MAITVLPHIRASWGGTIGTPAVEVWTNSIAMMGVTDDDTNGISGAALADRLTSLKAVIEHWWNTPTTNNGAGSHGSCMVSSQAALSWVKLNYIKSDGHYRDNPNTLTFPPEPGPGYYSAGTASAQLWQQSQVISFRTPISRGRGARGRIYPPCAGASPGPNGYISDQYRTWMQDDAVDLVGNLNKMITNLDVLGGPIWTPGLGGTGRFNCAVVSNGALGKPPMITPITSVFVDPIPDVQRRRVNRLPVPGVAHTSVYINT